MTTILAFLALLASSVECGISTSPFGLAGCDGGYPAECACR